MAKKLTIAEVQKLIEDKIERHCGIKIDEANDTQVYRAVCMVVKDILTDIRVDYKKALKKQGTKQVYYMSMEFLPGRALKNHMFNLGITDTVMKAVKALGFDIEQLCELEPDAGLGNGGLGRLAAAYMDALTSCGYAASGFSIRYEYGIFKQKIVNGWQTELPDEWLREGDVWLSPRMEDTFEVHFGGRVEQNWQQDKLYIEHKDYYTVLAVPYDMMVSGFNSKSVNKLRLWSAKAPVDFDMDLFSRGEYVKALENKSLAETISKVLYPADDHMEGKSLRLKQQYFFVSASIQSIINKHMKYYGTLDNLADKVAIHINDTHPALCIPELMRILLDDYSYSWEKAWDTVIEVISYTNHTVMAEALEKWPKSLFESLLPRIYQIVSEINNRFCADLWNTYPNDWNKVAYNAIISQEQIKMANLCLSASHTVNGVSELHSEILKNDVFGDYHKIAPQKFTNVTNGITHRRWLCEANPQLTSLLKELIGDDFVKNAQALEGLKAFADDASVLEKMAKIKRSNKERLANYIKEHNQIVVDPDSIFDVQVKRLHEYKRQLLNALHILDLYYRIKENPALDIMPRTFIFGAKAAPSYYMAKQIIRLIYMLGEVINNDPDIKGKIKVVFLENYSVSLAEIIMPAAEVSEQISVAGKEASGTGNMKFMINGAVTIGTMDGANIEIFERVGDDNIFIFGLLAHEIDELYKKGYTPTAHYMYNANLKRAVDTLRTGIGGVNFSEIADSLTVGRGGNADSYMVMADFESYAAAQDRLDRAYRDAKGFTRKSLMNVAGSGFFAADRSVKEYADRIWRLKPVK